MTKREVAKRARKTKKKGAVALHFEAVAAVKSGRSLRDVGEQFGVAPTTIMRWVKAAEPAPTIAERAEDIAPAPAEPPPEDEDTLDMVRRMQRDMRASAEAAKADGNHTAAQRFMRDAAGLVPVIARLEKVAADDSDVLRISRAEIEDVMSATRERVKTLLARPLLCAHCSRKLSIQYGTGGKPKGSAGVR
jgi:hypothetical protein